MKRRGFVGGITLAIIIIVTIILMIFCTTRVPAGYVAVQYNMNGGVKEEILDMNNFETTENTDK